jgi:hypothetical protein
MSDGTFSLYYRRRRRQRCLPSFKLGLLFTQHPSILIPPSKPVARSNNPSTFVIWNLINSAKYVTLIRHFEEINSFSLHYRGSIGGSSSTHTHNNNGKQGNKIMCVIITENYIKLVCLMCVSGSGEKKCVRAAARRQSGEGEGEQRIMMMWGSNEHLGNHLYSAASVYPIAVRRHRAHDPAREFAFTLTCTRRRAISEISSQSIVEAKVIKKQEQLLGYRHFERRISSAKRKRAEVFMTSTKSISEFVAFGKTKADKKRRRRSRSLVAKQP